MTAVSVIVPVYNREALLPVCLRSIAAQTFQDWECLIVDDGSTDSSVDVGMSFNREDPRFKALRRTSPRKGAAACRNQGIQQANGRYVIFLDSDDLMKESCLARRIELFMARIDCDFMVFETEGFVEVPGDVALTWNVEKPVPDLLRFLKLDAPWSTTSPIWKRSALLALGGFEESLPGWQDWQLHVTAILSDLKYCKASSPADSYHRLSGNDRISHSALHVGHVLPKARYVNQLFERHVCRLASDPATRHACVGLLWGLAVSLERAGDLSEALRVWTRLRKLKFVPYRMWIEGILALVAHGHPGGRLAWRQVGQWPASITESVDRSTFLTLTRFRGGS